jgi:hypothetical protein
MDARLGKIAVGILLGAVVMTGCASKTRAKAQAEAAFRAGQQQALRQTEARRNAIAFSGPVLNPLVAWTEGMTLGQAIAAAGWNGKGDPRLIILTRGKEVITMTPDQVLETANEPVLPGDHLDMLP